MQRIAFAFMSAVLVLTLAPLVHAAGLATPILSSSNVGNGQCLECLAVNIHKKPVTVTVELIEIAGGTVVGSIMCSNLAPGTGCGAVPVCCSAPACDAFCRFTGASKTKIRASIALTPLSTSDVITTLPAQ
jgi:hypothetical protein